jgi:hypothetical protein
MVGFIIGFLFGGFVGVSIMALCNISAKSDKEMGIDNREERGDPDS